MSLLIFVGLFSLRAGNHVHTSFTRRTGEKVTICHAHYKTAVACCHLPSLPAEICIYAHATDPLLPDETVAIVIAKGYVPPGNAAMLLVTYFLMLCILLPFLVTRLVTQLDSTESSLIFTGRYYLVLVRLAEQVLNSRMVKYLFLFRLRSSYAEVPSLAHYCTYILHSSFFISF
jgi:hypothetical protein